MGHMGLIGLIGLIGRISFRPETEPERENDVGENSRAVVRHRRGIDSVDDRDDFRCNFASGP